MEIFLTILFFSIYIILMYAICSTNDKIDKIFIVLALTFIIALACIILFSDDTSPKAIDVYRGTATLKIGMVDGIPQDSVVVWKNNIKE